MNKKSILIVKTSAIGDVIQTFPVLEYLRTQFPEATIDWVVEERIAPLLKSHPLVDRVITMNSKVWRHILFSRSAQGEFRAFVKHLREVSYDLLFDLQGNGKSAVVTASAKACTKVGFGFRSVREKWNMLATNKRLNPPSSANVRLKYLGLVQGFFADETPFSGQGVRLMLSETENKRLAEMTQELPLCSGPRFMVCFGSKWANKRLSEEALLSFLEKIKAASDPSYLFIFGDEEEKQFAERLSSYFAGRSLALGQLSLPLWQALMWEVDGVIAVDSAALHLCGTTQTPSFSIFGPTSSHFYKPLEERHAAFQGTCPYGKVFVSQCPVLRTCPTGACMRHLQADPLFDAYQRWEVLLHKSKN
jgi:heptosyltransferase I